MMRKRAAVLFAFLLLLCGCDSSSPAIEGTWFAMDTVMSVTAYGDTSLVGSDISEMLTEYESKWSVTDERSEIYAANHGVMVQPSPETAELIRFALEMNTVTDGALDITMYPVLCEWGFTTGEYRVPRDERIAELLRLRGCDKVQLTEQGISLPEGVQIDLGAVAKGYMGDLLSERLRSDGVTSALLDLGGNIHAIGNNPDGAPWRLGIRDPFGAGNIAILRLSDKAAVTSGGYERYFTEDGVNYCHILDPETGRPAESGLASVTIVGEQGRLCDALSTAVYVMGEQRAVQLWQELGGFDMILITDDGDMLVTEGVESDISPTDVFTGELRVLRNSGLLD